MTNLALATPSVSIVNNHAVTTSNAIADYFHKLHKNVLRAIENLITDLPLEFNQLNFEPVEYCDTKGETRQAYQITRDGFALLAMGFTGKKALAFKIAYIQQFNAMEAALINSAAPQPKLPITLTPAQQNQVQERVIELAKLKGNTYQAIYRGIKSAFHVGTYKDIPQRQYPALCKHLGMEPLEGEYLQEGLQQIAAAELPDINVREQMLGWMHNTIDLDSDLATAVDERAISLALDFHKISREHIIKRIALHCVTNSKGLNKQEAFAEIKKVTIDSALTLRFHNKLVHIMNMASMARELSNTYLSEMTELSARPV